MAGRGARAVLAEGRVHPGATLSNADVSAVISISKRARLPFDAIFAAEIAGVFKPDPAIYRMAATYLGLDPATLTSSTSTRRTFLDLADQLGASWPS